MTSEIIKSNICESIRIKSSILHNEEMLTQIDKLASQIIDTIHNGGKVIFAGNGGSFADAQHLAAEFVSRFKFDRSPLPSIALGTNSSVMSAVANDYGYEEVFSREILGLGESIDLFIPISTSGNSENLLYAVESAKKIGMKITALTGMSGGKLNSFCECIKVPSIETCHIQESHILIGHILCELVERGIFYESIGRE